jgi:hypothetical protein
MTSITNAAKTVASIAARLAAACIMSTLVLGSAVVPAKAATPTDTVTVPAQPVHRCPGLTAQLRRVAVINHLTCRTLFAVTAGAVPPPRSRDHPASSAATRMAVADTSRALV